MARTALLNVMFAAAQKAGRKLARDFGEVENLQVSLKGPGDFVSRADREAERTLRAELERVRPGYGFLGEEGTDEPGDGRHRWIVDPLDGTTNFLHGTPHFAISIGLERDGQIVAGLIYNPVTDDLWTAEKGGGAFLNDRRIRVSARRKLSDCVIGTSIAHIGKGSHGRYLAQLRHMMPEVAGLRASGSAALDLGYVAAGRLDGFFIDDLDPWDMAAGLILVREAGGYVTDFDGGKDVFRAREVLAGNEHVHALVRRQLARPVNA